MCVNMSQLFLALILLVKEYRAMCPDHVWWGYNSVFIEIKSIYGSVFGKRDLLAMFCVMKLQRNYSFKCCKPF